MINLQAPGRHCGHQGSGAMKEAAVVAAAFCLAGQQRGLKAVAMRRVRRAYLAVITAQARRGPALPVGWVA